LTSAWELREIGSSKWIPAHVPGAIVSDLQEIQKKGLKFVSPDQNLFRKNWEYRTQFNVDQNILGQDVVQLSFRGLEPYSYVYLNDSLLLKADNIFRSWIVNCKSKLKAKDNRLLIVIQNVKRRKKHHYTHFGIGTGNSLLSSESATNNECSLCSPGIWRPVSLLAWSFAKIEDMNLHPDSISSKIAVYSANLSVTSVENQQVSFELLVNNKLETEPGTLTLKKGSNFYQFKFAIERPKFWWTNGLGDPYLYNITVRLKKGQTIIHELHQRLGVRTIELVDQVNPTDKKMYLKLNGIPLFLKGAAFVNSYKLIRNNLNDFYRQLIDNVRQSNFNTIRVLNKGIYEDNVFYDLCDENGILVWQDFMTNPIRIEMDSTYEQTFRQEAIELMKRLRNHPCLALWWGNDSPSIPLSVPVQETLKPTDKENHIDRNKFYFNNLLPDLVEDYGNAIPYQHFSTFKGAKSKAGIDLFDGTMFGNIAMEYGIPSYGFRIPEQVFPDRNLSGKPDLKISDTCPVVGGSDVTEETESLKNYIHKNLGDPKDAETKAYYSRIAQAEVLKSAIESHRIRMPECMGTLYQQISGFTGVFSLSTIDSSGTWKPAQYAVKDAFSHLLVVPVIEKNVLNIYGVSDALKDLDAFLLVRLINFKGKDLFVKQVPVSLDANSSHLILSVGEAELLRNADRSECCLVVQLNQATKTLSQNLLYFTESKNLKLPKPAIEMDINETVKGYNIILRSAVLVKSVFLRTVSKRCWFSDNNIDLLPGKRTRINVRYDGTKDELNKDLRISSFMVTK